ncbi:Zn-ribbon domain-containing OB-fold protein [Salinirubellus sp. GCM10025818]|jgi:uncharacterized OB-fold protein|uniref:Zn-ribbon domain-containing OB-fold protein n=1 Tax=Salinirubellus TaxID=2162630 RepID=UPI0030D23425
MSEEPSPLGPEEITSDSPFTLPGFFDALSEGRLLGAVCSDCGKTLVPPRPACYACGSRSLSVEDQPRTGHVVSYTAVHTPPPAFADEAPYTIAVVELDSGARLTGRLDADYEDVAIDDPVELTVREPDEALRERSLSYETEWPLHVFEPR